MEKKKETVKQIKDRVLKPFNAVIQVCPVCNKVDVYKDDNHVCIDRRECDDWLWE